MTKPKAKTKKVTPAAVQKVADRNHPQVQAILKAFPEDVREGLVLTEDQVSLIVRTISDDAIGLTSVIPRLCKVDDCEFAKLCIFYKMGLVEKDMKCPEETLVIEQLVPHMVNSLSIDLEDVIEVDMLREYIDAIIQERRARRILAIEGEMGKKLAGIDQKSGIPYYEDAAHPALQIKEQATKKKERLRRDFLATREMREKYHKNDGKIDPSEQLALLRRRRDQAVSDADFEVLDKNGEPKPADESGTSKDK